jgi:antitoxin ParD1/3/4
LSAVNVSLPPDLDRFLKELVAAGRYNSPEEAICVGLRLLQDREEISRLRTEELQKAVAIGVEQANRGELIDGEEVFKFLHEKIRRDSGETP